MINNFFENNIEFSVFSNIVGDSTVTTIRLKADAKFSIIYFNGQLCMVKYTGGLITYVDKNKCRNRQINQRKENI